MSERRCPACGRGIPPDAAGGFCPNCMLAGGLADGGGPAVAPPGERCGDFELVEELGRGGMGVVWRARQVSLKREVALKMILGGGFATEAERRRFQSEAEAAAALAHPNIVPIFEVGEADGHPFYAMKLVRGRSLAERLAEGGMDAAEAAACVAKIARGVHHAHQHGILHRDLKPGNILLEEGEPMITDFGLAKRLAASTELTAAGSVLGSPNYMAPEQAEGRIREVSTATDVYSLGAILFHLLTGEAPFRADTPLATLKLVIESEPPGLRSFNAKADRDLETICFKCLAKQPSRRYASADALREDLERWLRHEPILARRAPPWERAWKWTRRHPAIAAGVVAVLATAGAGLAAVRAQFRQTEAALQRAEANALAERSARAAVIEAGRIDSFDGEVWLATFSPDHERVLVVSGTKAFIRDFESGAALRELDGHTSFVRLAEWSGDGQRAVTVSTCQANPEWNSPLGAYGDQTARVWDARTSRELAVIPSPFIEPIRSLAVNADGSRIALGSVDGSVGVWTVGDTNPLFVVEAGRSQVGQLQFSPDGSNVLAASSGDAYWIHRKHPHGASYGWQAYPEDQLVRTFDLAGRPAYDFGNAFSRKVRTASNFGLRQAPNRSSRGTFALSPDGAFLATAAQAPENNALWDRATGRRLLNLPGPTQGASTVAISRDSRLIAIGSKDKAAWVWERATGRRIAVLQPHPREVTLVAFSRDPRWLLTACADNKLRVWDVESEVCVALLRGHRDEIRSAEFSADGEEIISASADHTVRRWRWATFEQLAVPLAPQAGAIRSVRFSPDGRRVVTGAADGTARVCETSRGRRLVILEPALNFGPFADVIRGNGGGEMRDAAFTPDGAHVLTVRSDPRISSTGNPLGAVFSRRFPAKPQPFLPARLWDANGGAPEAAIPGANVAFTGVEFRADGQRVLLRGEEYSREASYSGWGGLMNRRYSHGDKRLAEAVLWDLSRQQTVALLDAGQKEKLLVSAFNPNDNCILTATPSTVQIWSPDGQQPRPLPGARGREWTAFSPDGRLVLSEDEASFPAVWETASSEKAGSFESLGANLRAAWFAADGTEVGGLTRDGRLTTWKTAGAARVWEGISSGRKMGLTQASLDRRWLAAVVGQQEVDLWDLQARKLVRTIERHVYPVTALGFSADGERLGTGDSSGTTWLWPLRLAGTNR